MTLDTIFRAALLLVLLFGMAWAGYHRTRAHRVGGAVSRAGEGPLIFTVLRLSGLLAWGTVIAFIINPRWVSFASMPVPEGARWFGLAVVVAGMVWLAWMFHALGLNVTDTVAARANGTLVTSGPYRYVRHPMYAALLPILGGMSLVTTNWIVVVGGAVAFVTIVARTRNEERHLLERYGDAYREYQRRTGGFFPRLGYGRAWTLN